MISLEKCRFLLGKEGEKLTNNQIEEIRDQLYGLATIALDLWWSEKNNKNRKEKTNATTIAGSCFFVSQKSL